MFFKHIKHTKQFTTMTTKNNIPKNKKKMNQENSF